MNSGTPVFLNPRYSVVLSHQATGAPGLVESSPEQDRTQTGRRVQSVLRAQHGIPHSA